MTTVDIADFVEMENIGSDYQAPVDDYLNNIDQREQAAALEVRNVGQEIIIERIGQEDLRQPRAPSQGSAPRNLHGALRDRGDRALEASDGDHPGLGDDQVTSRSQAASYYAGD